MSTESDEREWKRVAARMDKEADRLIKRKRAFIHQDDDEKQTAYRTLLVLLAETGEKFEPDDLLFSAGRAAAFRYVERMEWDAEFLGIVSELADMLEEAAREGRLNEFVPSRPTARSVPRGWLRRGRRSQPES